MWTIKRSINCVLCVHVRARAHMYLGCLWSAGYVDSAGFDSIGFGALEERKAALPPSTVSIR